MLAIGTGKVLGKVYDEKTVTHEGEWVDRNEIDIYNTRMRTRKNKRVCMEKLVYDNTLGR